MKVVVNMFEGDEELKSKKANKRKVFSRLKKISRGIKSIDDVKEVEAKVNKDK